MTRPLSTSKKTVELRPSRIRRDPALINTPKEAEKELRWRSSEWEIKLAIVGIIAFALAINIIIVAVSAYSN
jgi:hypothetical protein